MLLVSGQMMLYIGLLQKTGPWVVGLVLLINLLRTSGLKDYDYATKFYEPHHSLIESLDEEMVSDLRYYEERRGFEKSFSRVPRKDRRFKHSKKNEELFGKVADAVETLCKLNYQPELSNVFHGLLFARFTCTRHLNANICTYKETGYRLPKVCCRGKNKNVFMCANAPTGPPKTTTTTAKPSGSSTVRPNSSTVKPSSSTVKPISSTIKPSSSTSKKPRPSSSTAPSKKPSKNPKPPTTTTTRPSSSSTTAKQVVSTSTGAPSPTITSTSGPSLNNTSTTPSSGTARPNQIPPDRNSTGRSSWSRPKRARPAE